MKEIISVKNLVNRFDDEVIHDNLSFSIYEGEIIAIIGGSGAGKSVLLRSIIGLHQPISGSIKVKGKCISEMNKYKLLKTQELWGVLFQNGALFSSLTVLENVMTPILEYTDLSEKHAREIAEVKIELVGLKNSVRHRYPSELSGGMVKRAALARALALDPKILFLDEPTSGLDPISAGKFDRLIKVLSENLDISVVIITHDLDSVYAICDKVAVLVNKKIEISTPKELIKHKNPWIRSYFNGARNSNKN